MRRLVIALCLLSAMSGCQGINQLVSNSVSPAGPVNQYEDAEIAFYQGLFSTTAIGNCLGQLKGTAARQGCRDTITYARLKYTDLNYDRFRRELFAAVNGGNTAADLTILGLGSAGALVPGATTKAILAAISAGISGGKGIIDRDLLYNAAIQTLIQKMDGDRGVIRLKITTRLKSNETNYSFEEAELDSADYYQAGTLTNALVSLQSEAASQAGTTSQAINGTIQSPTNGNPAAPPQVTIPPPQAPQPPAVASPVGLGPAVSAPAPPAVAMVVPAPAPAPNPPPARPITIPSASAVALPAPVPATVLPGNAPLPAAAPPPVVAPPPVAAPPPAAPPSGLSSTAAADKAALLQALGYDPTSQSYDAARGKLLRVCLKKLGISVPAPITSNFLYTATYQPLYRSVANCINQQPAK